MCNKGLVPWRGNPGCGVTPELLRGEDIGEDPQEGRRNERSVRPAHLEDRLEAKEVVRTVSEDTHHHGADDHHAAADGEGHAVSQGEEDDLSRRKRSARAPEARRHARPLPVGLLDVVELRAPRP